MVKANLILKMTALLPLPMLIASLIYGPVWALVLLLYLTLFAFLLDEALIASGEVDRNARTVDRAFAAMVPIILGLVHFFLLPLAVLTLATAPLGRWDQLAVFTAFALYFGTIGMANAHELIHRRGVYRAALGRWIFCSMLFGHHVSAHLAVHHRYVATPDDPNTARLNEGFYHFYRRAWKGSFRQGLRAENRRLAQSGRSIRHIAHPYLIYCGSGFVFLALAQVMAGWRGVLVYLGLASAAQIQLLLSDYVQHYGLERQRRPDGGYQPVGLIHSWNAPQVFTSALMLNAPRHSDHHAHPAVPYDELRIRAHDGAPMLPYSVPVMSAIALVPGLWRKLMNPRVDAWRRQQGLGGKKFYAANPELAL